MRFRVIETLVVLTLLALANSHQGTEDERSAAGLQRIWKVVGGYQLLVSEHSSGPVGCPTRLECLMETQEASAFVVQARGLFPEVRLTVYPVLNGFLCSGKLEELLALKRLSSQFDQEPSPTEVCLPYALQVLEPKDAMELLSRFPNVRSESGSGEREKSEIRLFAPSIDSLGLALECLRRADRHVVVVHYDKDQLEECSAVCAFRILDDDFRVDCPMPDCPGPLHLLGLKQGDYLSGYRNEERLGWNEWWVEREERPFLIRFEAKDHAL